MPRHPLEALAHERNERVAIDTRAAERVARSAGFEVAHAQLTLSGLCPDFARRSPPSREHRDRFDVEQFCAGMAVGVTAARGRSAGAMATIGCWLCDAADERADAGRHGHCDRPPDDQRWIAAARGGAPPSRAPR